MRHRIYDTKNQAKSIALSDLYANQGSATSEISQGHFYSMNRNRIETRYLCMPGRYLDDDVSSVA